MLPEPLGQDASNAGAVLPIASTSGSGPAVRLVAHSALQPASESAAPSDAPIVGEVIPPGRSPDALTLEGAVEAAIEGNPDLVSLRQNEGVSQAAAQVARVYPFNPTVGVEELPLTRERFGGPTPTPLTVATIQQTFEMAHQRRYRASAGAADLNTTRWNIARAEMLTTAQTERLFFTAVYQRERHRLAHSIAQLDQELLGVLERSFSAGQTSAADRALGRLEAQSARQMANRAEWSFQAALLNLHVELGAKAGAPVALVGGFFQWQWQPLGIALSRVKQISNCPQGPDESPIDAAIAELAASRPDVMAARADLAAAGARLELADAMRTPNIKIGPFFEQTEGGAQLFGFQATRELAIVNNGRPLVRQRQAEVQQKIEVLRQLEIKARLEILSAVDRYERARLLAQESRGEAEISGPQELRRMDDLFRAGQVDLVRVYAARNRLLLLRGTYLDIVNDLAQAAADLTASSGLPAAALIGSTSQ